MEEPMWYIEPVSETGPADLGNADVYKRMDLWMEAGKFIEHWVSLHCHITRPLKC